MRSLLSDYLRALGPRRSRAALVVAVLTTAGVLEALALTMLIPLLNPPDERRGTLSRVAEQVGLGSTDVVRLALAGFILCGLGSAVLKYLGDRTILRLRADLERSMRIRLTDALLGIQWTRFHQMRVGDITKALVVEGFNTCYGLQLLIQAVGALGVAIVLFTVAISVAPALTGFSVAFGVLAAFAYRRQRRQVDLHSGQLSSETSAMSEEAEATFGSLKYVRATGSARIAGQRAADAYTRYAGMYVRANAAQVTLRFLFEGGGIAFVSAAMAYSVVVEGRLTSTTIAFLALFYRLAPRVHAVQDQLLHARTYRPWFLTWDERYQLALQYQETHSGSTGPTHDRALELLHVSLRFPEAERPALQDVDLTIPRGRTVAVVGESGSGKTTMLDILSGLLEPTSGQVLLDGSDLALVDREAWQSHLGVVTQETPLYNATVAENVARGHADPDRTRVTECLRAAHATEFVSRLPQGIDTQVGERGGRLSGGERQRIGLARALYGRPWVLLLDEATSALDGESEAAVMSALRELKGTCSMLLVTHRLSTAAIADEIIVLDKGRITQRGAYDELLADPRGKFAALASAQGIAAARA